MKITIEISIEDAAAIWADHTWAGKYPLKLETAATRILEAAANSFQKNFSKAMVDAISKFEEARATGKA